MDTSLDIKISSSSIMKYALPTILSTIFMNVYSLVDSIFVANLVGTDALTATTITGPFLAIALALGTMIATGGSALVALQIGEGKSQKARQNFSFFMVLALFVSTVFGVLGIIFREPLLYTMGADETVYALCEAYAIPIMITIPFAMNSILFQIFFITAGAPGLGFGLSLAGGIVNIILDYVLIAVFPLGIAGAGYATCSGYVLQSVIGVGYFLFHRKGDLYFVKPKFDGRALLKACSNGASEMVSMLAVTITMLAMNIILMDISGSDAAAASAVIMSAQSLLSSLYMGYAMGIAPIISYNYGKQDQNNLKKIYQIAIKTIAVISVVTFVLVFPLARPIALIFADGTEEVIHMAVEGIYIFAVAFLLMGFNMFASNMFTALNDGKTSAILSFFRTLIFLIVPLLVLPPFLGVLGVWISMPLAEILSIVMTVFYFKRKKSVYHYA